MNTLYYYLATPLQAHHSNEKVVTIVGHSKKPLNIIPFEQIAQVINDARRDIDRVFNETETIIASRTSKNASCIINKHVDNIFQMQNVCWLKVDLHILLDSVYYGFNLFSTYYF